MNNRQYVPLFHMMLNKAKRGGKMQLPAEERRADAAWMGIWMDIVGRVGGNVQNHCLSK